MRLVAPAHLVDINRIAELDFVTVGAGGVRIGALARHSRVLRDPVAASAQPLLPAALRLVAHATIRNRGTTVGSLVHADPSAEMPAVLALLGGTITMTSGHGRRTVAGTDFFLGPLESDVRPGEMAVEAFVPELPPRCGVAIAEVSRRQGDYAVCGVAARVELDDDLRWREARLAYLSMGSQPIVLDVGETLAGRTFDLDPADAVELAVASLDPETDIHASAAYRLQLARVLTRRVLTEAATSAAHWSGGESA
jgi:carbon-monoxide dehydrogenase medium subunit